MTTTIATTATTTARPVSVRSRQVVVGAALLGAAVVPLVTASIWYSIFGEVWVRLSGIDPATAMAPDALTMLGQLGRNAVVALTLALVARRTGVRTVRGTLGLAVLVWFGFQAMSVLGSVLHEGYPLALYLIHVGDALQTALVMAVLIGLALRARTSTLVH